MDVGGSRCVDRQYLCRWPGSLYLWHLSRSGVVEIGHLMFHLIWRLPLFLSFSFNSEEVWQTANFSPALRGSW